MKHSYWLTQSSTKPLFPDIEWNKPEQRAHAGKLAIIGGNKLGFVAIRDAYAVATELGAGQVRAILPDVLKKTIPTSVSDTLFLPSNPSGGFSKEALPEFEAACAWSDLCLLVGDAGRNSETAMAFETLLTSSSPAVVTRDAVDLLMPAMNRFVDRDGLVLVVSFAQLQKIFQSVYYPKILSFSMQLMQLVETLHKFTITYPLTIVTFHQNQLLVAHKGTVVTYEFDQPMAIWRGLTASKAATYLLWNPTKPLEAIATSFLA
jgi:hypothetical protein